MLVNLIDIHVNPESAEAFQRMTLENVRHSRRESGIARFDLIRHIEDPAHFMLIEVFHSDEAVVAHRETGHYRVWKEEVESMMARPRSTQHFEAVEADAGGYR